MVEIKILLCIIGIKLYDKNTLVLVWFLVLLLQLLGGQLRPLMSNSRFTFLICLGVAVGVLFIISAACSASSASLQCCS